MKNRGHAGPNCNVKACVPMQGPGYHGKFGSRIADEMISRDLVNLIP